MSMKKTTDELVNSIKNANSIEEFVRNNRSEYFNINVDEYLRRMLKEKNMKISYVSVNSGIGDYVYKVFNGTRKAARDVYIAIGIAMKLNYNEMQSMLRLAKYLMLDPRDERDSILLYAIEKGMTVIEINSILYNCNKDLLGKIDE